MQPLDPQLKTGQETNLAVTAWASALAIAVIVFANLVANQSTCSSAAHSAQGTAKYRITQKTTSHGTHARTHLGIAWVVGAASQRESASDQGRQEKGVTCKCHGTPLWL
jgi:hypothetical protein